MFEVRGQNRQGREVSIFETFSGVLNDLERRYLETESDYVRNEIGKYLRNEICPSCDGKRLKKEALSITVGNSSVVDITAKSIIEAHDWISEIEGKLAGREKTIAALVVKLVVVLSK